MLVYLDFNIVVSIHKNSSFVEKINSLFEGKNIFFPYSNAHIQEVDNITGPKTERDQRIREHLKTISRLTHCQYLTHGIDDKIVLTIEEPETVLETIREVPFGKTFMQIFSKFLPSSVKESFRKQVGVNPKELNNYKPEQVIEQINKKLSLFGGQSILETMETAIKLFPNTQGFGLHNRIAGIFAFLDLIGYWRDEETETSDYARLWDSYHAFFASKCKYFISDDRRTRHKTKVAYNLFKIETIVTSSNTNKYKD